AVRVRTVSMWATKHTRPSRMPPRATVVLPISMAKIMLSESLSAPPFTAAAAQPGGLPCRFILHHFAAGYKARRKIFWLAAVKGGSAVPAHRIQQGRTVALGPGLVDAGDLQQLGHAGRAAGAQLAQRRVGADREGGELIPAGQF